MKTAAKLGCLLLVIGGAGLACGVTPESERGPSARGATPLRGAAKGEGADSCLGHCGGQALGGCWCDDQCAGFGDCCADKSAVCDARPASCEGHCGGQAPEGCWCDEQCASYGDCCGDKQERCDAPPPPPQCFVGGCSSQLCTDDPDATSTCEYLDHYACFAKSTCGNFGEGGCGWEKTPAFVACMIEHGKMQPDDELCDKIDQMYLDAVAEAKKCVPWPTFAPQCTIQIGGMLRCGGCPTYVNSTDALQPVLDLWKQAKCGTLLHVCPTVLCQGVSGGSCDFSVSTCKDIPL